MSSIRQVQLKGLDILEKVVQLCEKHNLTYYLSSGTLLGAIRHSGFIPWDNDVDIEMPIEDYNKFLRIAQKELPNDLFLQTYFTDPGYTDMWAKVRANGTTSLPLMWKKLDLHWGIGIDIFPLIGLYENPKLRKLQNKLYALCRTLLSKDLLIATDALASANQKKVKLMLALPRGLRIALCRLFERFIFKKVANSKRISLPYMTIRLSLDKRAYGHGTMKEFETRNFMIPENYDYILTEMYGDYMTPPPESERNGHEGTHGKIIYDCHVDYSEYIGHI